MMEGFPFQVEVVRTDGRKSVSIHLDGGFVTVRAPKSLSDSRIRNLIVKRTPQIKTKLGEQSEQPAAKAKEYVSGEAFPYLGRDYRLKVIRGNHPSIEMKNGYLVATVSDTDADRQKTVKPLVKGWYREQSEPRLREKTERLSRIVGVKPKSVSVKDYKSRWGSCSARGEIAFNWKIILTPHPIVDYVVVHELCHLLEHNHSPRYWKLVERYSPNWKDCRDWLKTNPIIL